MTPARKKLPQPRYLGSILGRMHYEITNDCQGEENSTSIATLAYKYYGRMDRNAKEKVRGTLRIIKRRMANANVSLLMVNYGGKVFTAADGRDREIAMAVLSVLKRAQWSDEAIRAILHVIAQHEEYRLPCQIPDTADDFTEQIAYLENYIQHETKPLVKAIRL